MVPCFLLGLTVAHWLSASALSCFACTTAREPLRSSTQAHVSVVGRVAMCMVAQCAYTCGTYVLSTYFDRPVT
jgi:hypothetical protein